MTSLTEDGVLARIRRWAEECPDRVAVDTGGVVLTYARLLERAKRTAALVRAAGAVRGDVIAVRTTRDADYVASAVGAWLAGCAFLPLDTDLPRARWTHMLTKARARIVLGGEPPELPAGVTGLDPSLVHDIEPLEADDPIGAADPAYVIFTSGSTGLPKGVAVPLRALDATLAAMRARLGETAAPVVLGVCALTFDVSMFELFHTLAAGGTLVLADDVARADPDEVAELIGAHRVTLVTATPTWLRMVAAVRPDCLAGVTVLSIGEALSPELARDMLAAGALLWNTYGPTETTIYSTCGPVTGDVPDVAVPLGEPLAGEVVHVLADDGADCGPDVPGMLWIGGAALAIGYVGEEELTAASFVDDPARGRVYRTGDVVRRDAQGRLFFVGRLDDQVKVRGFRIELGEIEVAALADPGVAHAAAWVRQHDTLGPMIMLAVAGELGAADDLAGHLARTLPGYMVPARIVVVADWPVTASGKTDRRTLRAWAEPAGAEGRETHAAV